MQLKFNSYTELFDLIQIIATYKKYEFIGENNPQEKINKTNEALSKNNLSDEERKNLNTDLNFCFFLKSYDKYCNEQNIENTIKDAMYYSDSNFVFYNLINDKNVRNYYYSHSLNKNEIVQNLKFDKETYTIIKELDYYYEDLTVCEKHVTKCYNYFQFLINQKEILTELNSIQHDSSVSDEQFFSLYEKAFDLPDKKRLLQQFLNRPENNFSDITILNPEKMKNNPTMQNIIRNSIGENVINQALTRVNFTLKQFNEIIKEKLYNQIIDNKKSLTITIENTKQKLNDIAIKSISLNKFMQFVKSLQNNSNLSKTTTNGIIDIQNMKSTKEYNQITTLASLNNEELFVVSGGRIEELSNKRDKIKTIIEKNQQNSQVLIHNIQSRFENISTLSIKSLCNSFDELNSLDELSKSINNPSVTNEQFYKLYSKFYSVSTKAIENAYVKTKSLDYPNKLTLNTTDYTSYTQGEGHGRDFSWWEECGRKSIEILAKPTFDLKNKLYTPKEISELISRGEIICLNIFASRSLTEDETVKAKEASKSEEYANVDNFVVLGKIENNNELISIIRNSLTAESIEFDKQNIINQIITLKDKIISDITKSEIELFIKQKDLKNTLNEYIEREIKFNKFLKYLDNEILSKNLSKLKTKKLETENSIED